MSEMVERVARALCPEPDGPGRVTGDDGRSYPAGVPRWRAWEKDARAAIAAMRHATPSMYRAGALAFSSMEEDGAFDLFEVMIDAALAETPSPAPAAEGR